jgi:hypothetical protein
MRKAPTPHAEHDTPMARRASPAVLGALGRPHCLPGVVPSADSRAAANASGGSTRWPGVTGAGGSSRRRQARDGGGQPVVSVSATRAAAAKRGARALTWRVRTQVENPDVYHLAAGLGRGPSRASSSRIAAQVPRPAPRRAMPTCTRGSRTPHGSFLG